MRKKLSKKKVYLMLSMVILLIGIGFILFYPYRYVLYLQEPGTEDIIAYLPVKESSHFQLTYTHSVHLSDVYEEYRMVNGYIYPVQLIYEDTAIGMPSDAGKGETFTMKNGKYYISNLQGRHQSIALSIGKVRANHAIIHKEIRYALKDYRGSGTFVEIAAEYLPNWKLLRGVKMNE